MTTCIEITRRKPRILPGQHADDCHRPTCPGCTPCPRDHCRVCLHAHIDGTCPECMAVIREALRDIGRMCDALPAEVEARGVDGEAMMLLGPAADPEARSHLEASVLAGRVPAHYLDALPAAEYDDQGNRIADARAELHPLVILGRWDMEARAALEHDEPTGALTIATAVDYLDRQLTYLGGYPHLPFEDLARELRTCHTHLEQVLHDGEQVDQGAPCMRCSYPLNRVWGLVQAADGWACPRCGDEYSEDRYRLAVANWHREEADWLTSRDMEQRTGIKAGTVRAWACDNPPRRGPLVRKRRDTERTLYSVEDVERVAREKGMLVA